MSEGREDARIRDASIDKRDAAGLVEALRREQISRRQFIERGLALGLSVSSVGVLLAACGGGESGGAASPTPAAMETTKPATLNIFNWADYLAPSLKKRFEQETGIKIVETYFENNDQMLAKLKAGAEGYDITVTGMDMVSILYKSGLSQPVTMDYIPNFKYVDPGYQTFKEDPGTNGLKLSTPYQCGTTGVGVRLDKVKDEVTSWGALWDERYKGGITMSDENRNAFGCALWLLGYSLNSTSEDEVDQATQKLIEQKPLLLAYDTNNMKRNMIRGVPLVYAFNADCLYAMDTVGQDKLSYVLPSEGFMNWMDNCVILKGAPSPYGAHLFMDFILDPKNMAELTSYTWYNSPVSAAYDYIDEPLLKQGIPTDEDLKRAEHLQDVGEFARYYLDQWRAVMSA